MEPKNPPIRYISIMDNASTNVRKFLYPVVLASGLLMSAPFFVMLDNTLHSKTISVDVSNASATLDELRTTIIFKS